MGGRAKIGASSGWRVRYPLGSPRLVLIRTTLMVYCNFIESVENLKSATYFKFSKISNFYIFEIRTFIIHTFAITPPDSHCQNIWRATFVNFFKLIIDNTFYNAVHTKLAIKQKLKKGCNIKGIIHYKMYNKTYFPPPDSPSSPSPPSPPYLPYPASLLSPLPSPSPLLFSPPDKQLKGQRLSIVPGPLIQHLLRILPSMAILQSL